MLGPVRTVSNRSGTARAARAAGGSGLRGGPRSAGERDGFTLIELMVGLAVASIALVAGFSAVGIVHERGLQAEEVNRATLSGATQRSLLVDWLASARYQAALGTGEDRQVARFEGLDAEASGLSADELIFPTTARTPVNESTTVVRLFLDSDDETPEVGLVAELRGPGILAIPRFVELAPSAAGMEIRYLPEADGPGEWVDGWLGMQTIPRGVEIVLTPTAGESLPPLLQLPIRVALPSLR